jgi:hypothetical protein
LRSLTDISTGCFAVLTLSGSIYTVDFDRRVFQRGTASPDHDLRRDGDSIRLIALISCEVGESMKLTIDLDIPGVDYTSRTITPVVLILRVSRGLDEAKGDQ